VKARLREVLLIDDNEPDNFLHERAFRKLSSAERISVALNGREALDYLNTPVEGEYPSPELILLDVNMPVMNGWQFVEAYNELPVERRASMQIVMVTTSEDPEDRRTAEQCGAIAQFASKPVTAQTLDVMLAELFPDRFAAAPR